MAKFIGTPGDDYIKGTERRDFISSLQGDDTIEALGGNDKIGANDGDDVVFGGEGNDSIRGWRGNDGLSGGPGDDTIKAGPGDDFLSFSSGNDSLDGGRGNDRIFAGPGHDTMVGAHGADEFGFSSDQPFKTDDFGTNYIKDFKTGTDIIGLDRFTFTAMTVTGGPIEPDEFEVVATDADAAVSEAFITYSTGTGNLFYNENGIDPDLGEGGQFATLKGIPDLSATDFTIS